MPLHVFQGRPVVDGVYINGHGPYRFLLDTGAESNLLAMGPAHALRLSPTFQVEMITPSGLSRIPGVDGVRIRLGAAESAGQEILFSSLETIHRFANDIEGVLGQAFLSRFDYLLDLQHGRIEFGKQALQGVRVPFRLFSGRPAVFTNLGTLVLDSGADQLILFRNEHRAAPASTLLTSAGVVRAISLAVGPLVLEGRTITCGKALIVPPTGLQEDGLLPASLFTAVYVSNSERFLTVTN